MTRNPQLADQRRSGGRSDAEEMACLEVAIACDRENVAASMGELRRRVRRVLRWCGWLFHPVVRIAIGLSLGFIVGRRGRRKAR
jgi:hypothetical protein